MTATATHAKRDLFVTLPVQDLARSREFFRTLGFPFDPQFSSESSEGMGIGEQACVMLLAHDSFNQYSKRPMADPKTHAIALLSFSVPTRADVDSVTDAALAMGATVADEPEDHGFMYTRAFFDLDGHGWQVMWMNPDA